MGSPSEEEGRTRAEGPQHEVTIPRGFWLGHSEVTQAQWRKAMGNNPSNFQGERLNGLNQETAAEWPAVLPIEGVSWEDAKKFMKRLNARGGRFSYRLPTEAEWEYACRAGTIDARPGYLDQVAWYYLNSGHQIHFQGTTHPVGLKQGNAWNLQDMLGNVAEWCEDTWHDNYIGAPADGSAWIADGNPSRRVRRGGDWFSLQRHCRSASRAGTASAGTYNNVGFRVILEPASGNP